MDMFPIKGTGTNASGGGLILLGIVLLLANTILWFAFAFILAYGVHKGWAAA